MAHTVVPHLPHESQICLPPIVMWHALKPVLDAALHPLYVLGWATADELYAWRPMPQVVASRVLLAGVVLLAMVVDREAGTELEREGRSGEEEVALTLLLAVLDCVAEEEEEGEAPLLLAVLETAPLDCVAEEEEAPLLLAVMVTPPLDGVVEAATPLEAVEFRATDTTELRLAKSAGLVTVVTGTNVEPTSDTLERTVSVTLLLEAATEEETTVLVLDTKLRVNVDADEEAALVVVAVGFFEVLRCWSERAHAEPAKAGARLTL